MLDRRARARLLQSRTAWLGALMVAALVAFALIGPWTIGHDPLESDFVRGVAPDGSPVRPNAEFWLGTDRLFRDVLSRLAWGGRLSLFISASSTVIATGIGTVVGVVSGWNERELPRLPWPSVAGALSALGALAFGKPVLACIVLALGAIAPALRRFAALVVDVDGLLMRLVDVMLAFPFLLLIMAIGAALDGSSAPTILLTLGATGWLGIARVVRAKTMLARSAEYMMAARALGQTTPKILVFHLFPNIVGTVVVSATLQLAQMIVADSALSYLGVGISPPTPTWGRMLFEGQDFYATAPWLVAAPAVAIVAAVWGFNMLGEGLRDALDPHEV